MTEDLAARFKERAALRPNAIAIHYRRYNSWNKLTYGGLARDIGQISFLLTKEGIGKGDRVAILMENRPEWPAVFFAIASVGAVSVPVNYQLSENEIRSTLKDSGSRLLFSSSSIAFRAEVKVIDVDSGIFQELLKADGDSPFPKQSIIKPSELACILYTSGTTAMPKGVMLTHGNLLSNTESLRQLNIILQTDIIMSVLPLYHIYPLNVTMIYPLIYGATIIYPGSLRPEIIIKAMQDMNPTEFMVAPQMLYMFHKKIVESLEKVPFPLDILLNPAMNFLYAIRRTTGINLSRLLFTGLHKPFGRRMRIFMSGGAKLDEDVERDMFKFGFTVLEGYGLTETSPILSCNTPAHPKIGSAGRVMPGVELKVEGPDPSAKNSGEILARGPNIMKGYYNRPDLTKEVIKDGWFHTGDIGYMDKDGYLFLTGRINELIVLSSGKKIYPQEVEEVYGKVPAVKDICVFAISGMKDVRSSNILWAVVQPNLEHFKRFGEVNLRLVLKERFDNASRAELPSYKRIRGFTITLDDLPRTRLGKLKRYAVKEIYGPKAIAEISCISLSAAKELSGEELSLIESETAGKVLACLKKKSHLARPIMPSDSLELDLGIDSLGRIELASLLEEAFNIEMRDEDVSGAFIVGDLITAVEGALQNAKELSPGEKDITLGPDYWKKILQVPPKKKNLKNIGLNFGFLSWLVGLLVTNLIFYPFFRLLYGLRIYGKENVPKDGPYILYSNHASFFDAPIVLASLPQKPTMNLYSFGFRPYLLRPYFDAPPLNALVKAARFIPLDFSSYFLESLRCSYYILRRGNGLLMFPEGLRSATGEVGEMKKGFSIIVKETGSVLVPVAISGAHEAWPSTARFPKRHPIKVKFGNPVLSDEMERKGFEMGAKDSYDAICVAARSALVDLCEEVKRIA